MQQSCTWATAVSTTQQNLATRVLRVLPDDKMNLINVIPGYSFIVVQLEPQSQCEGDAVVVVLDISTDVRLVAILVVDGREGIVDTLTHLVDIG